MTSMTIMSILIYHKLEPESEGNSYNSSQSSVVAAVMTKNFLYESVFCASVAVINPLGADENCTLVMLMFQ